MQNYLMAQVSICPHLLAPNQHTAVLFKGTLLGNGKEKPEGNHLFSSRSPEFGGTNFQNRKPLVSCLLTFEFFALVWVQALFVSHVQGP